MYFYQKLRTSRSEKYPCSTIVRTGQISSPPDCGRPLWTATYKKQNDLKQMKD